MKRRCSAAFVGLAIIASAVSLSAQTHFASVTGTVTSSDGVSVPKVKVVATNQDTQVTYTAVSNDEGLYTITALPIGTYVVTAQAQTFRPFQTNPIKLESGQNARIDISLAVGTTENVEVTAVSPILQTQNAVVGAVISQTTIERMPLNGRNFSQLALLLPGVMTTAPDTFTEPKNFGQGRPYVNGQREQENNYMLDGMDMNEAIDNLLPYQPSPDALQEVRVDTNNYSAEYGNVAGALVNSTIKSGTNQFHGNAFEYYREQRHGRELVGQQSGTRRKGGSVAAHLRRDHRRPDHREQAVLLRRLPGVPAGSPGQQVVSVAPAAWRQGDFSGVGVVIRDPVTGLPFPGNQIPQNRFSPIAKSILANQQLYPLPTLPGDVEQPRRRLVRQAARPSGRREGRREPVDQRSVLRPLLLPELQVRAGAARRSKAS